MADEEAAALRAQIAALSGAIDQRRSGPSNYGAEGLRGRERGRGRGGRGRGAPTPSRNRTLVLSTEPGFSSLSRFSPSSTLAPSETSADGYSGGWVKRKTTHNMSLVSSSSFEKTEPARLAALEASRKAGKAQASPFKEGAGGDMNSSDRGKIGDLKPSQKLKPKPKPAIRRGDNMGEVIIDGVTFEFDETGTKLVKKAARPRSPSPVPSHMSPSNSDVAKADDRQPSTPLKTSVNGQAFVRTKRGNLISVELLAKRKEEKQNAQKLKRLDSIGRQLASVQRARNGSRTSNQTMGARWSSKATKRGLCAFFNKTGQCKRGLSCPYTHDASKIAICPGVLRSSGCTQAPGSCLLSHDIRPERVPHCVHYLRTAACRNGEACPYTHPSPTSRQAINVRADNICPEFTKVGWCDGGRECKKRHTWDCPAFVRSGQCQTKGCRLLHVIRAESLGNRKKGLQDEEEEGLQDADLFVRDDSAFVRADDDGHGEDQEEEEEEEEEGDSEDAEEKEEEKEEEEEEEEKKEDAAGEEDSIRGKDSEAPMKRKRQDEQIDFSSTRQKRKTAKDFIGQQDFISFTEADDDGDDDGDIDCSIKEEGPDGSVHSDSDDGAGGDM